MAFSDSLICSLAPTIVAILLYTTAGSLLLILLKLKKNGLSSIFTLGFEKFTDVMLADQYFLHSS